MPKIFLILISTLALLLPWHGAITVFLPDWGRFWKEVILILLLLVFIFSFFKEKRSFSFRLFSKNKMWENPVLWAILFLIWLGLIILIEQDYYSILSARYLGLGFFVFILISGFVQNLGKKLKPIFKQFSNIFITSTAFSVLFGIWGKFGGGFDILQNHYAKTISSWVPGQTIPLYHQTSEGIIRMQGGASGPVEFGHLLFVAVFLQMSNVECRISDKGSCLLNYGLLALLFFGLWQSGSRAALGGGILLFIFQKIYNWTRKRKSKKIPTIDRVLKYSKILLVTIGSIVILKIILLGIIPKQSSEVSYDSFPLNRSILRLSDSDHFTRPIQAIQDGFLYPFIGKIGSYGPAARIRSLKENNNDSAPIAENIFADYFVQMGLIGFILALAFWISLFFSVRARSRIFIGVSFLLVNMATLFDMTPLSLIFFTIFAFLVAKYSK